MKISNEAAVSRRHFLQGAGLAAASVAAAGMLAGCAANGKEGALSETGDSAPAYEPSETMDVDIVVVGSGSSGVAATVQAAELGAVTLLLEKKDVTGGGSHSGGDRASKH